MNYAQHTLIEGLYKRFRAVSSEYSRDHVLFANEERKLYNSDLKYKSEDQINEWIRERHNNLLRLERGAYE